MLAAGAAAGYFVPIGSDPGPALATVFILVCTLGAALAALWIVLGSTLRTVLLLAAGIGLVAGYATVLEVKSGSSSATTGIVPGRVVHLVGIAGDDTRTLRDGRRVFTVSLRRTEARDGTRTGARGRVLVFVRTGPGETIRYPHWGQQVSVSANLVPAQNSTDVSWIAFVTGKDLRVGSFTNPLMQYRVAAYDRLSQRIDATAGGASGLFRALFLGDESGLQPQDISRFQRAGCAHILALSGMHLGILTLLFSALLSLLVGRRIAFLLGLFFVALYIFVVGLRPSLVRAGIMYMVFGMAAIRGRPTKPMNVLALAFFFQLVLTPRAALTLSFQLSYLALAGILVFSPGIHRYLSAWITPPISLGVSAAVGAQIASLPLLVIKFGVFYPIGTVAGLVLSPVVLVFMWAGIIGLVLGSVSVPGMLIAGGPDPGILIDLIGRAVRGIPAVFSAVPGLHLSAAAAFAVTLLASCAAGFVVHHRRRIVAQL